MCRRLQVYLATWHCTSVAVKELIHTQDLQNEEQFRHGVLPCACAAGNCHPVGASQTRPLFHLTPVPCFALGALIPAATFLMAPVTESNNSVLCSHSVPSLALSSTQVADQMVYGLESR